MGIHSEPSFYSNTLGQIWKEKEKVKNGYYSEYYSDIKKGEEDEDKKKKTGKTR